MSFNFVTDELTPGDRWLHDTKSMWIVRYPGTPDRAEFFQAYRAVAHVRPGRQPWTVDNRRIGTDRGFATFDEAVQAAEAMTA